MTHYQAIRGLHMTFAAISIGLFALRGAMQFGGRDWRRLRWLRVTPHLNDTLLLAAAVTLAVMSDQYPLQQNWLTAKVLALLVYIAAGRLALKPAISLPARVAAFAIALASVGYIVAVAVTHSITPGINLAAP